MVDHLVGGGGARGVLLFCCCCRRELGGQGLEAVHPRRGFYSYVSGLCAGVSQVNQGCVSFPGLVGDPRKYPLLMQRGR